MQTKKQKKGIMDIVRSPYARQFIKTYKWNYLLGIAILLVINIAQTEVPMVIGSMIDKIDLGTIKAADFRYTVVFLIVVALLVMGGRLGWRFLIFGASRKIERDMRNDLFSHLLSLPQVFHRARLPGAYENIL